MDKTDRLINFGRPLAVGTYLIDQKDARKLETANSILKEAEAAAENLLLEAKQTYAAENDRGYAVGFQRAQEEALQRLVEETRQLDQALINLASDLSDLVIRCVREVLNDVPEYEKTLMIVRSALKKFRHQHSLKIRVDPKYSKKLEEMAEILSTEFTDIEHIEVVEDTGIPLSKVIIQSSLGRVECDLDQSVDLLSQALRREISIVGGVA